MTKYQTTPQGLVPLTPEEEAHLDAFAAQMEEEKRLYGHRTLRQYEYPPFGEYLDGVVKGDQAQIQAYIDACLAVKAKYPKATE